MCPCVCFQLKWKLHHRIHRCRSRSGWSGFGRTTFFCDSMKFIIDICARAVTDGIPYARTYYSRTTSALPLCTFMYEIRMVPGSLCTFDLCVTWILVCRWTNTNVSNLSPWFGSQGVYQVTSCQSLSLTRSRGCRENFVVHSQPHLASVWTVLSFSQLTSWNHWWWRMSHFPQTHFCTRSHHKPKLERQWVDRDGGHHRSVITLNVTSDPQCVDNECLPVYCSDM